MLEMKHRCYRCGKDITEEALDTSVNIEVHEKDGDSVVKLCADCGDKVQQFIKGNCAMGESSKPAETKYYPVYVPYYYQSPYYYHYYQDPYYSNLDPYRVTLSDWNKKI